MPLICTWGLSDAVSPITAPLQYKCVCSEILNGEMIEVRRRRSYGAVYVHIINVINYDDSRFPATGLSLLRGPETDSEYDLGCMERCRQFGHCLSHRKQSNFISGEQ